MATTINHDAFARESLVRDTFGVNEPPHGSTCSWCGNVRRTRSGGPSRARQE